MDVQNPLYAISSALASRRRLVLENIAHRHQPEVLQRNSKRPRLRPADRALWGAPRIHGELLKLGYDICESTVAKYMVRRPGPPAQTWQTYIRNHLAGIVAIDFFTVHTAAFRTFYVFLVLSLDRRRIVHFISYQSPWQNGCVERVIGSLRRECLDHVIVFGERHLRRVLREYIAYYQESRTHLGPGKDAPEPRAIQPRDAGTVTSIHAISPADVQCPAEAALTTPRCALGDRRKAAVSPTERCDLLPD